MMKAIFKKSVLLIFFLLPLQVIANTNPSSEPRASASVAGDMSNTSVPRQSNNTNPYQGEAPVTSYAPADWQKAVSPALKQVLTKLSGNANVAQIPVVQKALKKPNALVQSYNYLESPEGKGLMLQVRFSQKAINTLLQDANQPNLITGTQAGEVSPVQSNEISASSDAITPEEDLNQTPPSQSQSSQQYVRPASPQRVAVQPPSSGLHTGGAPIVEGVPVVALDSGNTIQPQADQAESFAAPVADDQFTPEGGVNP